MNAYINFENKPDDTDATTESKDGIKGEGTPEDIERKLTLEVEDLGERKQTLRRLISFLDDKKGITDTK